MFLNYLVRRRKYALLFWGLLKSKRVVPPSDRGGGIISLKKKNRGFEGHETLIGEI